VAYARSISPQVSAVHVAVDRQEAEALRKILKRIQAGRMQLEGMVSQSVRLEELESAFSRLRKGEGVRTVVRF
jgi:Zn-dependent alcohol dehydrogenase